MTATEQEFQARLAGLGARIDRATKTLEGRGVLQGETREIGAALQLEQLRLEDLAKSKTGEPSTIATLAREFEGLSLNFEKWSAEIDKHFEKGF